jgi:hypothetical protein
MDRIEDLGKRRTFPITDFHLNGFDWSIASSERQYARIRSDPEGAQFATMKDALDHRSIGLFPQMIPFHNVLQ